MSAVTKGKPTNKGKIAIGVLSVILVLILAASVTFNVLMYKKIASGGGNGDDITNVEKPPLDDGNVVVKPGDDTEDPGKPDNPGDEDPSKPVLRRLGISPKTAVLAADNSAINVLITVTPDVELPNTAIDWTIKFNDSASAWATGKTVTDYATITPESDGAFKANLSVTEAFGEQIIVSACVRGNDAVKAYCTVDYAKKYSITNINVSALSADAGNEFKSVIAPVSSLSEGTIDDTITLSGYLKPTQDFINFITAVKGVVGDIMPADYASYLASVQLNAASDKSITANQLAFIQADSTQREGIVATFSGDNIAQHMYRLLDYGTLHTNSNATWSECITALNTLDKSTVLTANLAFNNYVKAQAQNGNITAVDSKYVLSNAFEVVYSFSGEYNKQTTYRKSIPFVFELLPASVSSITINPGSIIV